MVRFRAGWNLMTSPVCRKWTTWLRSKPSPTTGVNPLPAAGSRRDSAVERGDLERAFGVVGAYPLLVELADRGLRHRLDERPALRQLPLRDLLAEEVTQLLGR